MAEPEFIRYEVRDAGVARIVLARPEVRNAQNVQLLYELNDAFNVAARDETVRTIVLAAEGPHFSSGHDLADRTKGIGGRDPVGTWCGFECDGAEAQMSREKEIYLGFSERWRNIPKPTIAEVRGKVISGGLMLVWPCDLIVASENTVFVDNTVALGVCGAEFFNHPWEVGARVAKQMLFTSDSLSAQDARMLGMVNFVVTDDELETFTMELATRIAEQPAFALKLAKEAVNATQDAQGRQSAQATAFALHQLSHSHNQQVHGSLVDPSSRSRIKKIASRW